ncbi:carbonic anhydrase-like isoform X2 [Portunus trituberculatus]|uniref:carbonic anhydrase-like isoform X2 n=1 Tax=Portunus trituberculatus TaxID=210409 RepID=UPI001E1D054F|nr:carbonic anhydrase-like isoform X2 [Portunus trituberculatus]
MNTLVLVLGSVVAAAQAAAANSDLGPHTWQHAFPKCGSRRQSPVAILPCETEVDIPLTPFHFVGYDAESTVKITNTGHSVQVNMDSDKNMSFHEDINEWVNEDVNASVTGGSLTGEFVFHQFHFHWGATDTRGSEHTIHHVSFPAELHLVHYRRSYGSFEEAVKYEDGVAVFAVMLELSDTENRNLLPIVYPLRFITLPHETVTSILMLRSFLPTNVNDYFGYLGSLTTPGCDEVVQWTIFGDTIPISSSQLKEFRMLTAKDGSAMQHNFRPLQPLNDREVYRSWM